MKVVKVTVGVSSGRNKQGIEVEGSALDFENKVKGHFAGCCDMPAGYGEWAWITNEPHAMQAVIVLGCYDYYTGGVKSVEVMYDPPNGELTDQLHAVLNRINIAAARLETQTAIAGCADMNPGYRVDGPGWNQKANAPISGPALHSFNETMLCEDFCTDSLQSMLAEGWRVIAVCPQESRRPDYVLGRFVNTLPLRTTAMRG